MKPRPGQPYPLGASWDGSGVNFALFSEHALGVQLCLARELHEVDRLGAFFDIIDPVLSQVTLIAEPWDLGEGGYQVGPDSEGNRIVDDSLLLLFNAHSEALSFRLPDEPFGRRWQKQLDTTQELPGPGEALDAGVELRVEARNLVVLSRAG